MSSETLSEDQENAIKIINLKKNIFISGNAGTGKSYLLKYLKKTIPNIHLTASTGISSVNIGGQTIHSWSGIGLGNIPVDKLVLSGKVISRIKYAKILAIDEISMISAKTFDLINDVTKFVRKNNSPFGGIQLVIFGDFFQLPPVDGDFCFNSNAWTELDLSFVILKKIFRQSDEILIDLLNNVRFAKLSPENISVLKNCQERECNDEIKPIRLVSHNNQADKINNTELEKLQTLGHTFKAKYRGTDQMKIEFLKKNCIAYDTFDLKIGSHVMMIKNTYSDRGIINGSVGIVKDISESPVVLFENGVELFITKEIWELQRYDDVLGKIVIEASIEQIPLIFSWAITIHKSQGMTLSKIRCDLSKVFTYGQSYVALSRVKSLDGLYIDDINFDKIRTSESIIDFYESIN